MRACCIAQGPLLNTPWQPKWEGDLKKGICAYTQLIHFTV